jgi:hypothetical protein
MIRRTEDRLDTPCGLIQEGIRVMGCGIKPGPKGFPEYHFKVKGYESLWSVVTLCPKCEAKLAERVVYEKRSGC